MKKRTMYSMHHSVATPGRIGMTVPFLRLDVAPGDTWSGNVGMLIRFSPLKRALLMDLYVDQYLFYVPWRLVWDQWEDFIAAGPNSGASFAPPINNASDLALWLSDGGAGAVNTNNGLYRRAYNLIWNEFFRDGERPPIGSDIIPAGYGSPATVGSVGNHFVGPKRHWINETREKQHTGVNPGVAVKFGSGANYGSVWPGTTLPGVPVEVGAVEILRAIAEAKLQLRRATYGTRYVDILKSYGVRVNYSMLQLPEIVASAHGSVNVTDVVSTGPVTDLGYMRGHAIQGSRIRFRRKSFSEHGVLLGIVVVRPPFTYRFLHDYLDRPRGYTGFYDPALELLPSIQYDMQEHMQGAASSLPTPLRYGPWGEWYRSAPSRCHEFLREWQIEHENLTGLSGGGDVVTCERMQADADFVFNDVSYGHFQVSAVNALKALRLISRGSGIAGVG